MAFPTETTKTTETTKLFGINFMHDFLCMAAIRLSHNQFLKLPHGGKEKSNYNYCKEPSQLSIFDAILKNPDFRKLNHIQTDSK